MLTYCKTTDKQQQQCKQEHYTLTVPMAMLRVSPDSYTTVVQKGWSTEP